MIFLVLDADRVYALVNSHWQRVKLRPKTLISTDLVIGFYKEDFKEWTGLKRINFFDLKDYISPSDGEETAKELVELLLEKGIIREDGRYSQVQMAKDILLRYAREFLSEETNPIEEEVFYGGRAEFYTLRAKGDLVYYDINSAYGWAMVQDLPARKYGVLSYPTVDDLIGLMEKNFVVFKGSVYEDSYTPVLPIKTEEGVFYPVGQKSGYWTGYELLLLKDKADIYIEKAYIFPYRPSPLSDIVQDFYQKRNISKAHKAFYKKQIVLLYGLLSWKQKGFLKSRIAGACITSRTHYKLYTAMERAMEYGKVVYCDTDAFILLSDKHESFQKTLDMGKDLGQWSIREKSTELEVLGYKRYLLKFAGKTKIVFSGERVDYVDEEGNFYRENHYTGELKKISFEFPQVPKRKILSDGNTIPYNMEELLQCDLSFVKNPQ